MNRFTQRSRTNVGAKDARSRSGTTRSRAGDRTEPGADRSRSTSISIAGLKLGNKDVDIVLASDIGIGETVDLPRTVDIILLRFRCIISQNDSDDATRCVADGVG